MSTQSLSKPSETSALIACEGDRDVEDLPTAISILSRRSSSPSDDVCPSAFTWTPFIAILFMSLVQPLCFELIFPFINQMVLENGIADDPEDVGFYSGIIESAFQFMSFITIMPCSFISDHFGRRPIVLLGTAGMSLSIALFGLSKSYGMMIATRCIGGTLGGTWSALKVMMAEIYTDKSHRTFVYSTFQIAFRIGQISGQPLGGLLSHPEKSFRLFDMPFWYKYPFSLPCFVASAIGALSVLLAYLTLRETKQFQTGSNELPRADAIGYTSRRPSLYSVMTPHVISVVLGVSAMALASETIFAVYPLFAFTPIASGGLGLSAPQIGAHMAIRSALTIVILFFYQPLSKLLGSLHMYQVSMALWPLNVILLPILNLMARTDAAGVGTWPFNAVLLILFILWGIAGLVWPSSQIIVVEAPSTPEALAIVNGIAQTVQALMMAIAPALVTSLFAFSIQSTFLGGNIVYAVLLAITIAGAIHSFSISEKTDHHDDQQ